MLVFAILAVIRLFLIGFRAFLAGFLAGALAGEVTALIAIAAGAANTIALVRGLLAALIGFQLVAWAAERYVRETAELQQEEELERQRELARRHRRTEEEQRHYWSPD